MQLDALIYFGDAVKALDDAGKVGGYLVRFGGEGDLSRHRDVFLKSTNYGPADRVPVLYHHGLDPSLDATELGIGSLKADDVGVWVEAQLKLADDYQRHIFEMVKAGKLGWSSGACSHLVRRAKNADGSHSVKNWIISEASLTPTPADPSLMGAAVALKSLLPDAPADAAAAKADHESPDGAEAVAAETLLERSTRLVADADELACLFAKAADQRHAEGRHLSRDKRDAIKALSERLAALAVVPGAKADPDTVRRLRLALLRDRV